MTGVWFASLMSNHVQWGGRRFQILAGGAMRLIFAMAEQFPGRGWVAFNGLVTFALGVMIWRQWPESGLWVIGTFVGIDLIFLALRAFVGAQVLKRLLDA